MAGMQSNYANYFVFPISSYFFVLWKIHDDMLTSIEKDKRISSFWDKIEINIADAGTILGF